MQIVTKNILLNTDYTRWEKATTYIRDIKREQHFLKHLIFRLLCNNPLYIGDKIRVLVYIHAGFGDRAEKDYHFTKKNSTSYHKLIQTDDWNDIGGVEEFKNFFYNYNIPL